MIEILITILLAKIAYTDHKTMKIPNKLNLAIGVCGLVSCIQNTDVGLADRIIGFLIISVPMYFLCLIIPEAFGGGDIKLMFLVGLVIGYEMSICNIFFATFLAFPIALFLLIAKKDNMIPFGPFLSMSAILLY
ncbi:MAG: prepilin peptidase, partial [Lachnospiraceae bacterium]|nr:prepilin peptidase [Lachnospiraceae bacterium]